MNFYEGWLAAANVRAGLQEVQELVQRLRLLLDDY